MQEKKRKRYTKLVINETSGVDRPAQEPALAVALVKRAPEPTEPGASPSEDPATLTPAGDGANDNGEPMSEETTKATGESNPFAEQMKAMQERMAKMEQELQRQRKMYGMNDQQKAYFEQLEGADADAFVEATPEKRAELVEATKAADAVVYKSADGIEYRKSDDPRLVALAKQADERERELAKARDERAAEVYKARAKEELAHLPGETSDQIALLKAIDGIGDEEVRARVLEMVKANDADLAKSYERAGRNGQAPSTSDPEEQLDALAKRFQQEHKVGYFEAYKSVLNTPEGQRLQTEQVAEQEKSYTR